MKPLLKTAVLLLVLGGCSSTSRPSTGPSRHAQPMRAQILPSSPGVGMRFRVNRPGYAALYQIIPGAGVSQVFPGLGSGNMDGRVVSELTSLHTVRLANLEQYAPSPLAMNGPRFYFLITSDRPLDIDRFGTFGYGLRRELGLQFTGFNAFQTMERIAQIALPTDLGEANWSTDFYVDWPNVLYRSPVSGLQLIPLRCGSYSMWVPLDRVMEVDARVCHPDRVESETHPAPADSGKVEKPTPRAPEPPSEKPARPTTPQERTAALEIGERIRESVQLETADQEASGRGQDRPGWQRVTEARGRVRSGTSAEARRSGGSGSYGSSGSSSAGPQSSTTRGTASSSGSSPSAPSAPSSSPSPSPAPSAPAPAPSPSVLPDNNGG